MKYALVAILLSSLAACDKDPKPDEGEQPSASKAPASAEQASDQPSKDDAPEQLDETDFPTGPDAPPVIDLVRPGADRSTVLRMKPTRGTSQTSSITVAMSGDQLPAAITMKMGMKGEVTETRANGDYVMSLTITDATMTGVPGGGDLGSIMNGMELIQTMSPRGDLKEVRGGGGLAGADQFLDQSLGGVQFAFPEEPVGVGSSWKMRTVEEQQGFKVYQTVTFTVAKIQGSVIDLDVQLDQKADDQTIQAGMQSGKLERLRTTGGGSMTIDLTKPVPLAATLSADMKMKVSAGGVRQDANMSMKIDLTSK